MRAVILLALISFTAAATISKTPQRIVGGSDTTIDQYPMIAALLFSDNLSIYEQGCGGTIINNRSVLTASHCVVFYVPVQCRLRLGSSYPNSGGDVYIVDQFITHPYDYMSQADISIVRSNTFFIFSDVVTPGSIAGPNYVAPDNAEVWAAGWGATNTGDPEQLQHVKIYVVNHDTCKDRYGIAVTDDHICAGLLDVGGQSQCYGDSGGPLLHNKVLIGITAFGYGCGNSFYPGVNTKVSHYAQWIQDNA